MSVCVHGETDCVRCAVNETPILPIHLHLILDVSPSMIGRWSQTISGLNEYTDSLRADQKENNQPYKVTMTTFSSNVTKVYDEVELDSIPKFDEDKFRPYGSGTALYDAIGPTVEAINTTEPVLVVIITDGDENSSRKWNETKVSALLDTRQKLGNYTYAYLGVDKAAWGNASSLGATVAASNMNLTADAYGLETYKCVGSNTRSYSSAMRSNRVSGQLMNVRNFFSNDQGLTSTSSPSPNVVVEETDVTDEINKLVANASK